MTTTRKSSLSECGDSLQCSAPRGMTDDARILGPDASETGYLLQSPANAARLRESLRQLAEGEVLHRSLPEA